MTTDPKDPRAELASVLDRIIERLTNTGNGDPENDATVDARALSEFKDRILTSHGGGGEAVGDYTPGELDRSAPPRIWLQIDTAGDSADRGEAFPADNWEHVSWCQHSIGGLEIEYVRADLYTTPQPRGENKKAVAWDVESVRECPACGMYTIKPCAAAPGEGGVECNGFGGGCRGMDCPVCDGTQKTTPPPASQSAPSDGGGEVEYEFEVWQDAAMQAGGSTSDFDTAKSEAEHYAMMYGQDGPVEVRYYRKERLAAPTPEQR